MGGVTLPRPVVLDVSHGRRIFVPVVHVTVKDGSLVGRGRISVGAQMVAMAVTETGVVVTRAVKLVVVGVV